MNLSYVCSSQEDPTRPRHSSRLRSQKRALHRSQKALLGETPSACAATVGSVRDRLSRNHPIAPPPDAFRPKTTDTQWTLRPSEPTAACVVVCTRCYPSHLLTVQPTYPRTDPIPAADDLAGPSNLAVLVAESPSDWDLHRFLDHSPCYALVRPFSLIL